ncbi:MAG: hypothetical protein MRK02_07125 [Candidatus Scalindua sp.]|nr:hypothetical protein [Candidatus Scalindua sp.]
MKIIIVGVQSTAKPPGEISSDFTGQAQRKNFVGDYFSQQSSKLFRKFHHLSPRDASIEITMEFTF